MTKIHSISFKPSRFLIALLLTLFLLFALRIDILRSLGSFLIAQDKSIPQQLDALFILSGNSYDRANGSVEFLKDHHVHQIICTGANQIPDMKVCCPTTFECDFTKMQLGIRGVRDSIVILKEGTSTQEESDAVLKYCKRNHLNNIVVITTQFHCRRTRSVFVLKFKEEGIAVFVHGVDDSKYEENQWWNSEYGLLALQNEYVKLFYYFFK